MAATSTSFVPATVNLTAGQAATITIATVGLAAGDVGAQFNVVHNNANTTISNPQCVGIFAGANPTAATQANGDLLSCTFVAGGASGTSGNVMTFTLTNTGGATETISFNNALSFYLQANFVTTEPLGTTNTLVVTNTPAVNTPTPTFTFTATATVTGTATLTPTGTVATATPTATATRTNTPTNTATPPVNNGTLVVCKTITTAATTAVTFSFTTPPGGPNIPSITVPAGQLGPVCAAGVSAFAGSVAVTEVPPAGYTLTSVTGGTLAGNTATATITAGQTTTLTFTNTANTGTLIVCKQLVFTGPLGTNGGLGLNGIGGLNPPGLLGGVGFNPLGPVGGLNGLGSGLNGLSQVANTFTFTASPAVTIPSITIPAGQLGPICGAGVAVAAGTVAVTEVVPTGFTLTSVTGGTLSGNTATATITSGQTTTLTFTNDPGVTIIVAPPPLLPPPPLQFIPPPPPPLLPPPPAPAMAAGAAPPSVPVIPESDSVVLLGLGLAVIGGFAALRRRYRLS
jgi:hypothetical protein